jgi:hypothetical protein
LSLRGWANWLGGAMGEAQGQTLQRTAQVKLVVTAESTSGRPRGDSGSSASTDATKLFEDEEGHRSRASSARTSGEPGALVGRRLINQMRQMRCSPLWPTGMVSVGRSQFHPRRSHPMSTRSSKSQPLIEYRKNDDHRFNIISRGAI